MSEKDKQTCRAWIDAFNRRDEHFEREHLAPGYVAHAPESLMPAPLDFAGWQGFTETFVTGFPDLHLEVVDAVADDEMVAQRIYFTGTHTGDFQGLPPTGKRVSFTGLELNRMVDGQVAVHWFQLDQVALLQQLGLVVLPGPRLLPRLLVQPARKLLRKAGAIRS